MTDDSSASRRRTFLALAFWFVAGDAMTMQTRGPLLASFEADFGVSEGLLGLVAPAGTVGFVVAIIAVGFLAGQVDVRRTLLIGVGGTVAALVALAAAPVYWLFLAALVAQGAMMGVFRGVDRPLLSHLYPARLGRTFVLYGLAWSLGAVTGPILVSAVLELTGWRWTFLLLALWFLPVFAVLWARGVPTATWSEHELDVDALRQLVARPRIRGVLASMALLGGIEGIMFTWLPYYARTLMGPDLANLTLSAYLLAYVPGRVAYARLVGRHAYFPLAIATVAVALPMFVVVLLAPTPPIVLAAIFLVGIPVSGLFPLLSAYGVETATEYSGPLSALTTAATYVGIASAPVLVGVLAELYGIAVGMIVVPALGVVLLASLAYIGWRSG